MKQVGLGRRSGMQPDQSCLVCSLMARYAKSKMEMVASGKVGGASRGRSGSNVDSLLSSSVDGKFNVEVGLASFSDQARISPPERQSSMTLMPPPPPRSRPIPVASSSSSSAIRASSSTESFGSPPVDYQLMNAKIATSDPSMLGKSVDSNVRVPFPILRNAQRRVDFDDDPDLIAGPAAALASLRRPRAESLPLSYDERQTRVKFAPTVITSKQYYLDEPEEGQQQFGGSIQSNPRPRSASCSNMGCNDGDAVLPPGHGCETIAEEGVEQDEPVFSMD